ncbi:hypothetical protein J6590_087250 [Homalodisca vitripennis]|nr:hypothetical protein J6590_087250 [Homalodisca vitripennis]
MCPAPLIVVAEVTPEESITGTRKCDDRRKLQEAIQKAVIDRGDVRYIVPKARLEILALSREFPVLGGEIRVSLFKPNLQEQRKAVVELLESDSLIVLRKGKIKVGWVVRIRIRNNLFR